ncbi:hypothetical protein CYMTET_13022 [Cymbomonas tetramitiformis]|uniref:CARDB domain-containing protein n=1 Tax=Cymbomonas tetramitiformis TaxID=36881 RepID=A0AAE0GIY7_9CHLO|nr:hypothetical protein CYMTET_13022 [Cymbomonas tetramitiformis]KAK3279087.1 hypothetical protein CYMTET_13022 [Cymbomonas tetramitiformis]KAK3279088.1 hypothetical protein CYMTET_13022 [Cymbomonas tetramitiformis]KAK3279089.1 hypothetical protein CYMTET_13022 [Cymbomonas tetramitiformis]
MRIQITLKATGKKTSAFNRTASQSSGTRAEITSSENEFNDSREIDPRTSFRNTNGYIGVFGFDALKDIRYVGARYFRTLSYSLIEGNYTDYFYGIWKVEVHFTSNSVTLQVVQNAIRDVYGNANLQSNLVVYTLGSQQSTQPHFKVAGIEVPFEKTVCLTPEDVNTYEADCPVDADCKEGGCIQSKCMYNSFTLNYTEFNPAGSGWPVGKGYVNVLYYDGEAVLRETAHESLDEGQSRSVQHNMNFGNNSINIPQTEWGVIDREQHKLELYLDERNYNRFAGKIFIQYCGFSNSTLSSPPKEPCGCVPNLDGGLGLGVGDSFWDWSTKGNCLNPEDSTVVNGKEGVFITITERETVDILGNPDFRQGRGPSYAEMIAPFHSSSTLGLNGFSETFQVVEVSGPQQLVPGETKRTTFFMDLPPLDRQTRIFQLQTRIFQLQVDSGRNVSETSEANRYDATFDMCWPADLQPGDLTLHPRPGTGAAPIPMKWGGEYCITPQYVQKSGDGYTSSESQTFYEFSYWERNEGYANIEGDSYETHWFWDGFKTLAIRQGALIAGERVNMTVTLDFGEPDVMNASVVHELRLCLDCLNEVAEVGHAFEYNSADNREANNEVEPITLKFCNFGVDLHSSTGVQIGTQFIEWTDFACLVDADFADWDRVYCIENGCQRYGGDAVEEVEVTYTEGNVGLQEAEVWFTNKSGWRNEWRVDGMELVNQLDRPDLKAGGERLVSMSHTGAHYGLQQLSFRDLGVVDKYPHNFTLNLDVQNDVPWKTREENFWWVELRFCTSDLMMMTPSQCGCPGDLVAIPEVTIGRRQTTWGTQICLDDDDVDYGYGLSSEYLLEYAGVNVSYGVKNIGEWPARGVPGWNNRLYFDGNNDIRDYTDNTLDPGQSDTWFHPWIFDNKTKTSTGLQVVLDTFRHEIKLAVDPENLIGETDENNNYTIAVYFRRELEKAGLECPDPPPALPCRRSISAVPAIPTPSASPPSPPASLHLPPAIPPIPPPPATHATTAMRHRDRDEGNSSVGCTCVFPFSVQITLFIDLDKFEQTTFVQELADAVSAVPELVVVREVVAGSVVVTVDILPVPPTEVWARSWELHAEEDLQSGTYELQGTNDYTTIITQFSTEAYAAAYPDPPPAEEDSGSTALAVWLLAILIIVGAMVLSVAAVVIHLRRKRGWVCHPGSGYLEEGYSHSMDSMPPLPGSVEYLRMLNETQGNAEGGAEGGDNGGGGVPAARDYLRLDRPIRQGGCNDRHCCW